MAMSANDPAEIPSKMSLLQQMWQYQTNEFRLLAAAESSKQGRDLKSARQMYDRLIAVSKDHLQCALLHNQHHENPVDIPLIVQPLVNAMLTQGDIRESLGDLRQAEELRTEALELSRQYLSESASANAERSRAASLITQGRFNEALVALVASRDMSQQEGDAIKLVRATIDMVDVLQWLGDFDRALSELTRATTIALPLISGGAPTQQDITEALVTSVTAIMSGAGNGKRVQDIVALYRIALELDYYQGLVNKHEGNLDDAERFFRAVLPEYEKQGAGPAIEFQLASILVRKGQYAEGLSYAKRLEGPFTAGGFLRPKLAALLKVQGEALLNLDEGREAVSTVEKAIDDLTVYHDPDLLWELQWLHGRALEEVGQAAEAVEAYYGAAQTVNRLRRAPLGYRLDSTYLSDKLDLFERGIGLTCRQNLPKKCCTLMEMIKSRTLTATLSIPPSGDGASSGELGDEVDELTRQIDALEFAGYREGQTDELSGKRETLLSKRASLLERIRFSDPRWRPLTEPVPFDCQAVAKILHDQRRVALGLYYRHKKVVAILLREDVNAPSALDLSPETVKKLTAYQDNLQSKKPDPRLYDPSAALGLEANELIPPDMLSEALDADALVIVPHGPLHLVPWSGLVFDGKRLFEYGPVGILPNLSCIPALKAEFSTEPRVALIGSPDYAGLEGLAEIGYTKEEVQEIQTLYSGRGGVIGDPLIGEDANEDNFWELAHHRDAENGILHIACHGKFDAVDPMNSALLLTGSKVDASEIARTRLTYDEVILSACRTGERPMEVSGVALTGDDILGLPAAFLEAGARSVLVSIPKASDAASYALMVRYHDARVEGRTPLFALHEAQTAMLTEAVYPPHFWIGFTVYGFQ
jgi:CHAT domain-containing protein/tetratricopeptide (TPR) repeat protein